MLTHFNFEEFDSPDAIGSGLPKCQSGKMDLGFLHKLDEARAIADTPFIITSGYRTPEHNAKVGGRINSSSHLKGVAVDISCRNSSDRAKILKGLFTVGLGRRVGIAKGFIHVDMDMDKPSAIWLYQ
jgi:zinc D-Ala-D-Ala carboxypeptidase|tara:strand:+ start:955 stop:1335 length:381 start_codon:yes stop_codon:yes gene_type:complete